MKKRNHLNVSGVEAIAVFLIVSVVLILSLVFAINIVEKSICSGSWTVESGCLE